MRRKTCCRQCRVKPSWPLPQHCVLALEMRHSWTMCTLSRKQKKCHAQCTLPQKPTQNEEYVVLWLPLRCFLVSFTQRKTGPFCRTPTETGHLGISHLLSIFCFLLLWFPRSQNLLLPDLSAGSNRILNPRQKKWNGIISKDWGKKSEENNKVSHADWCLVKYMFPMFPAKKMDDLLPKPRNFWDLPWGPRKSCPGPLTCWGRWPHVEPSLIC